MLILYGDSIICLWCDFWGEYNRVCIMVIMLIIIKSFLKKLYLFCCIVMDYLIKINVFLVIFFVDNCIFY